MAPKHVASFLKLTKEGFYDGGAFHRIIPGFVIQGGDPNAKVGYGPGALDGADKSKMRKGGRAARLHHPGRVQPAAARVRRAEHGPLRPTQRARSSSCLGRLTSLDNKYTVFGKLTKGDDVLKRIAAAQTVQGDIPFKRQGIERVDPL